ncbi:MAG TPA: flagellar motor switch protein FliN, partial [Fibrobacteria bacterium]|nr:flagellar motor switch protein FliN [Fibrobacteria bacterium]
VIGTLLGRSTSVSMRDIRGAEAPALSGAFGDEGLAAQVTLEGLPGDLAFVMHRRTAALLAGLMLGGDGTSPFKDEDLDAVNELGNQVLGSICTALGGKHGTSVSASQARTVPLDPAAPPFPIEGAVLVEADLAVEGAEPTPFWVLLSQRLAESLAGGSADSSSSTDNDADSQSSSGGGALAASDDFDQGPSRKTSDEPPNIQMLLDINLNVTIELGRTRLSIRKILELGPGSIIELDRLAGEPVDLLVNDKVVAKGEVVVVDEYFGIRIISLVSPEERIKQLR